MFTHPALLPHCVYCGDQAVLKDHVLPHSRLATFKTIYPNQLFLVACCRSCNSICSSYVFKSYWSKWAYTFLMSYDLKRGAIQWDNLIATVPHVRSYLKQLDTGISTAQLDAELAPTNIRSVSYFENGQISKETAAKTCQNCSKIFWTSNNKKIYCGALCATRVRRNKRTYIKGMLHCDITKM